LKVLANFYSLWAFLALQVDKDFDVKGFAGPYADFMNKVAQAIKVSAAGEPEIDGIEESVRIYAANSRGASTDLAPRLARHNRLKDALVGVVGVIDEDR